MSLDIEWSKLDQGLTVHVKNFLNRHFKSIGKPAFIGDIEVTAFDWGNVTPSIEITDITDPFPEFYEPDPVEEEDEEDDDNDVRAQEDVGQNLRQEKKAESERNSRHSVATSAPSLARSTIASTQGGHGPVGTAAGSVTSATASASASASASVSGASATPTATPAAAGAGAGAGALALGEGAMRRGRPSSTPPSMMMMDFRTPFSSGESEPTYPYPARMYTNPLSQQQQQQHRFNLMHPFHRSPFVAPQHPSFHPDYHYFPPFSPPAAHTAPVAVQDWIDEEDGEPSKKEPKPSSVAEEDPAPPSPNARELDFQASLLISYKGDMSMTLLTELRMNYPSMMFMSLPIQLCVRSVEFEATAVVAYIKSMDRVCVSMLEPEDMAHASGLESLLRDVHIESIVGDKQKQVLKNVGKIEKFIVDQLRKMLDDELVFPSYQCIQLD